MEGLTVPEGKSASWQGILAADSRQVTKTTKISHLVQQAGSREKTGNSTWLLKPHILLQGTDFLQEDTS